MFENVLVWLGLSKGSAIGGFFGAAVSLKFLPGAWWQRLGTGAGGWACAAYLAPLLLEVMKVSVTMRNEMGVAFLVGLFGMSVVAQILSALPQWADSLRTKVFGKSGD